MFKSIANFFTGFYKPNLLAMKANELLEAQVNLLKAQSGMEYAKSMVDYHATRVDRLTKDIKSYNE